MTLFLFFLFFFLIAAFLKMLDYKIINRGLPQFPVYQPSHRLPDNSRRKRGDTIEITSTQGILIIAIDVANPKGYALYEPKTGKLTTHTLDNYEGSF